MYLHSSQIRHMISAVTHYTFGKLLDVQMRVPSGLVPIGEYEADDIFVVGYPKSGHTWFQNLLVGIVYGMDNRYAPDSLIQDLVPDVHYKKYYRRYMRPMFFKSHMFPTQQYKRVVYLLRDGRD